MKGCCFGGGLDRVDAQPIVEKIEVKPSTGQESRRSSKAESRRGSKEDTDASQDGASTGLSVAAWLKGLLQAPEPKRNPETAWLKENMQQGNIEDKYITKKLLGKGAYASVWSSVNQETKQYCAIKCIDFEEVSRDKIDKTIAQLAQETRLHLKLHHRAIMHLEEFYLTGTKMYIILEIMRGGSLLDLILERGGLKEGEAKLVFKEVFEGLEHMHSKNIIHRDIKLENMMLGELNDLRSVKIADFGFAIEISTDEDKAKVSGLAGTPVYMAPEAVDVMMGQKQVADAITPGLDMWAAGVALYMLVGGYPPFEGKSSKEIFKNIYKANVAFKEPSWRNVSDECISLLTGLLQRKQKDRLTATQALKHKWFKDAVGREDLSQTLAPSMDGGPRVMMAMDRLERLNSTKLDDSIYIKKSLLLEIQERHSMSLGAGMDHSLMRIFSENKQKVKTTYKKKKKKKQVEPAYPEEVKKVPSIGTLIGQVAGPPRYDTEYNHEGEMDDVFDPSLLPGPRISTVRNEGEQPEDEEEPLPEPEQPSPSVFTPSNRTAMAAAFPENAANKSRAYGAAAMMSGAYCASPIVSPSSASIHRSVASASVARRSGSPQQPQIEVNQSSSRADSRGSNSSQQSQRSYRRHPLLPDNYMPIPSARQSRSPAISPSQPSETAAEANQQQNHERRPLISADKQRMPVVVQGDVLGCEGGTHQPGAAGRPTPPAARGGW